MLQWPDHVGEPGHSWERHIYDLNMQKMPGIQTHRSRVCRPRRFTASGRYKEDEYRNHEVILGFMMTKKFPRDYIMKHF